MPDVERERVWSEEIEPNFHDHAGDAIATSTPRQLPFHGTVWRRRGKQLLIFRRLRLIRTRRCSVCGERELRHVAGLY